MSGRTIPHYRYREGQPLSVREEEVLFGLSDGLTNKEIALDYGISDETVKMHIRGILIKMNARNRTHAVALAFYRGILVVP